MEVGIIISNLLGWIYTFSWSISFYPQILLNFKRKSITGLSLDFLYLNVFGFFCYSIFTLVSLTSETVREEYKFRHEGKNPLVQWNDFAFALHATVISSITVFQSLIYKRDINQKLSRYTLYFFFFSFLSILLGIYLASSTRSGTSNLIKDLIQFEWLDLIYLLSYIKILITLIKYLPQAYLNFKRKSTQGWSIINILLDLTGGILSLAQLGLDSYLSQDFSFFANPGKLGLSLISIIFDFFFVVQHFILYRNLKPLESGDDEVEGEEEEGVDERSSLLR